MLFILLSEPSFTLIRNDHHHIALVARISLTLSRDSSLSFIALGRSSGHHPVSSHSCLMYVCAGRPAFARPCVGVHKSTSLMSSSPASPAVSCMSGSSNLNSFRDRRQLAVQLVSCGVLPARTCLRLHVAFLCIRNDNLVNILKNRLL